MTAFLTGLGTGLSLIIAIGAQNAFVLRQGLRREHLFTVALICATSDAVLVALGVSGIGFALQAVPWLVTTIRWVGAAFLVSYAILAFRRALHPEGVGLTADTDAVPGATRAGSTTTTTTAVRSGSLLAAALTTLALTWLNPHVYLDTVFMLGSLAQAQGESRWIFAAGAVAGSFLWFFGLAYGARLLSGVLASPRSWQILDAVIGVVMLVLAVSLVRP